MLRQFTFIVAISCALAWAVGACQTEKMTSGGELVSAEDSAYSTRLTPQFEPAYYIDQGVKYFRTMESSVPAKVQPIYAKKVVRWEWPPWLWLTGYGRGNLIHTDILLKLYSTSYDTIDCRFFPVQPFCRCHVIFNYSGTRIPIYEEFTFNDQGEITFIEAWSDYPSLLPMSASDYWAEGENVDRLSSRVPGLGSATGRLQINAAFMRHAALTDTILADMLHRIKHPVSTYIRTYFKHRDDMKKAHLPPPGDQFPYH